MLGITSKSNASICNNLAEGNSIDTQLEFTQDKCMQAAMLMGLHAKAQQVQPRRHIAGNKRVMTQDLLAQKQ